MSIFTKNELELLQFALQYMSNKYEEKGNMKRVEELEALLEKVKKNLKPIPKPKISSKRII